MATVGVRLATYLDLGLRNLARVGAYRLGLKAQTHPVLTIAAASPRGPFFRKRLSAAPPGAVAREGWRETGLWFGAHPFACPGPPDWHLNPFTGTRADSRLPWHEIADFDERVGDIKAVWEASRFDWLLAMAQRSALGECRELERLNQWLGDWSAANPPYRGANWKCGQEASIRVMHLALASLLLDQSDAPEPSLLKLVEIHLRRIRPTLDYAIGQQNNHATSEAAALFIGGSWLAAMKNRRGEEWARLGRRQLDKQAVALIARDGSFSQYSLVYHRVMLDSYCFAESWRRRLGLKPFAPRTLKRLGAATLWLHQLVDSRSGDGPNLGANDGARLMGLTDPGYRDFRPTLQWAAALFLDRRAVAEVGAWDQPLKWLGIEESKKSVVAPGSISFDDGGLHVLRKGGAVAYLRYPRFRFRPSQADALHVDLWSGSDNILRDAGTFSYNSVPDEISLFSGTAAHNTVQFDCRDQMPRIGRFLFGAWLRARGVRPVSETAEGIEAAAGYRDRWGAEHHRTVRLESDRLICIDRLSGTAQTAVLRWRLRPGDWRLDGYFLSDGEIALTINPDRDARVTLSQGLESLCYLQRSRVPVLEVHIAVPAKIHTSIAFE